jgi:hypothetical protein
VSKLLAQVNAEFYETMKMSLTQLTLKTPIVKGMENEDKRLRRMKPEPKGGGGGRSETLYNLDPLFFTQKYAPL